MVAWLHALMHGRDSLSSDFWGCGTMVQKPNLKSQGLHEMARLSRVYLML